MGGKQIEDLMASVIRKGSKTGIAQIVWGTATEIKETTCRVIRDDAPSIEDVLLNAIDDVLTSNYTIYPKEGSMVLVGIIENLPQMAVLLRCSEVDRIVIKTGQEISMEAAKDASIKTEAGISLNAGNGNIEIKNNNKNLADILGELINAIIGIKIAVSGSAGTVSPTDQIPFQKINTELKLLLK